MIQTFREILFSIYKKIQLFEVTVVYDCEFQQVFLWCSLRLRRLVVHIWSSVILTSFRPHIQQTMLEITGRTCCASRASRWKAPMIFTPGSMKTTLKNKSPKPSPPYKETTTDSTPPVE